MKTIPKFRCLKTLPLIGALMVLASQRPAPAEELRLATLDQYALAAPAPGDRMSVTRPFETWTLRCDLSISLNRRLCSVEQSLESADGAVFWRLAQTADERYVLIFSAPPNLDTDKGMSLTLDGFQTNVTDWSCQSVCIAAVALSKPLQSLLFSASTSAITYSIKSGPTVTFTGSMTGFSEALQAAAEDPFGKRPPRQASIRIPIPTSRPSGE